MSEVTPDWQEYENAIARHYAGKANCKVLRNQKLTTQNGRRRQIDVIVEVTAPPDFKFRVVIEAKNYNRKLDSDDFDAIRTKIVSVGADLGIIFCPMGLESGPQQDLEKYTNPRIELRQLSLNEVLEANWGDDFLVAIQRLAEAKVIRENISRDLEDEVVAAVERLPLYARYFFHRLDNPAWLEIFMRREVLKRSVRRENAVLPLLASELVIQFVAEFPELFLEFCSYVESTFRWLETDLISASLQLPNELRSRFVDISANWEYQDIFDSRPISDLIKLEVSHGNVEGCLRLLSRVTRIETIAKDYGDLGEVLDLKADLSDHWFQEVTWKLLPQLVAAAPREVSDYARTRLVEALRLRRPTEPNRLPPLLIANVADEGQFGPHDILHILVLSLRDVLIALGKSNAKVFSDVMSNDLRPPYNGALARVAMFAAGETQDHQTEVLELVLANDALWHDYEVIPELEHLIEQSWPSLHDKQRAAVVNRVMTLHHYTYRTDMELENAERHRKNHIINWLLIIEKLQYPTPLDDEAAAMLQEFSAQTGKTEIFKHEGFKIMGIDPTPNDARDFATMTPQDILSYCESFEAQFDFMEEKTPHGVSSALQPEITKRPDDFIALSNEILRLPYPAYHSAIVRGLRGAIKAKTPLKWLPAIELVRNIYLQGSYRELQSPHNDPFDFGKVEWVRHDIASFIDEAAQIHDGVLETQDALYRLWTLTWPTSDPHSSVQGELDWLTICLNSEAGHHSMALCRLAIRAKSVARSKEVTENEKAILEGWFARLLPVIEEQLLHSKFPIVRAPLGYFYSWFYVYDQEWASERTHLFFDRNDRELWEAAWSCHFWMTQRYVQVFKHLIPEYSRALKLIPRDRKRSEIWADRLGDDFAIFWMQGTLEENEPILIEFWERSSPSVRTSAALWITSKLSSAEWFQYWERAKRWWELAIEHQGNEDQEDNLGVFLHWLKNTPETVSIAEIENLMIPSLLAEKHFFGDRVFEFIEGRVSREPDACARIIEAMTKNEAVRPSQLYDQRFKDLMRQSYDLGTEESKNRLRDAQRRLLVAGFFDFENVLPKVVAN